MNTFAETYSRFVKQQVVFITLVTNKDHYRSGAIFSIEIYVFDQRKILRISSHREWFSFTKFKTILGFRNKL